METKALDTSKLLAATQKWLATQSMDRDEKLRSIVELVTTKNQTVRVLHNEKAYIITPKFCLVLTPPKGESLPKSGELERLFMFSDRRVSNLRQGFIELTPLLKELLRYTVQVGFLSARNKEHIAIYRTICYQLVRSENLTISVPIPKEPRILKVYQMLMEEKLFHEKLDSLAKKAGASSRTIERLLESELRVSFTDWRRQMRMQQAILMLSAGKSVTEIALEVGYKSTSAFINAFKDEMGLSPKQFSRK